MMSQYDETELAAKAEELLKQGKPADACEYLSNAIAQQDSGPRLTFLRGLSHFLQGSDELALDDYNVAIEAEPSNVEYRIHRGELLAGRDDTTALADFQSVLSLMPSNVRASCGASLIFLSQGEPALSLKHALVAVAADSGMLSYFCAGRAYLALGDFSNALAAFDNAISLTDSPQHIANVWSSRGDTLVACGEYSKAIQSYCESLVLDSDPMTLFLRGRAHAKAGEIDLAIRDFSEVLATAADPTLLQRAAFRKREALERQATA